MNVFRGSSLPLRRGPSERMGSPVQANVEQVMKEGEIRIHPMVARQGGSELLGKMGATSGGRSERMVRNSGLMCRSARRCAPDWKIAA